MDKFNHYEKSTLIPALAEKIFEYVDDHHRFSSHMNQSSWMMAGGKMETIVDKDRGQKVGSHITMKGNVLGLKLFLDEVVTEHNSPKRKVWKTVGNPNLIVIGNYQMGIEINPSNQESEFKVFIDYSLPPGFFKFMGLLFGDMYAKWCVNQMVDGVAKQFHKP